LQKIALIAFPLLHLEQASVQNSARATLLQGGQFNQQEKKQIQKNPINKHSFCDKFF
jgi:hypothetical protein